MKYYLCKTDLRYGFRKGFVYQYIEAGEFFINDNNQRISKIALHNNMVPEQFAFYFVPVFILPNKEVVPYFSEGQLVRVKKIEELKRYYGLNENGAVQTFQTIPEKMMYICGLEAIVTNIKDDGTCKLTFKDLDLSHNWIFSLDMICPVENSFQEKYKTAPLVSFGEATVQENSSKQIILHRAAIMKNKNGNMGEVTEPIVKKIPIVQENQFVKMRSGAFARVIVSEYGVSFEFLDTNIIIPISSYDENLKTKTGNSEFDIAAIYESFDKTSHNGRDLIWEE